MNGGKHYHRWVNDQLKVARNSIENTKKNKKERGDTNAYKKTHEKDNSKSPSRVRTPKLNKSTSSNDIYNNNVNYESHKPIKLLICENIFNIIINK